MNAQVFSEALRATARIACCLTLLGCPPKTTPSTDQAATSPASALPQTTIEEVSPDDLQTCVTTVVDFVRADRWDELKTTPSPDETDLPPAMAPQVLIGESADNPEHQEIMSCCQDIARNPTVGFQASELSMCCDITGRFGPMCSPWGPPRPPEMAFSAGAARQRARSVVAAAASTGVVLDLRDAAQAQAPKLPTVAPDLRAIAQMTWASRMINEHESHTVFLALADRLESIGLDEEMVAKCREFADEERSHGVLCGAVVEALGGAAAATPPDLGEMPTHADVGDVEAALRDLLSICCLSETVAVALIGAERLAMPKGPLRDLLTRIYADECGHAHFGWRLVPQLLKQHPTLRGRLSRYLRVALAHLEEHELAHLPRTQAPPGGAALGLCDGADARRLFYATVERIILPGLQQMGLDAFDAWAQRSAA
ncbi:MAG: ferritin-like domain-containing protein [Myxococcota bacterium]